MKSIATKAAVPAGLILLALSPALLARQGPKPPSLELAASPQHAVPLLEFPVVDTSKELALDDLEPEEARGRPLRFAVPFEVAVTPQTAGRWETLSDGGRLWRLRFYIPGATDLNFGFTRFWLPAGASLYVVSEREGYYEGPYTQEDNEAHGELWTPLVPGDRAWIELYLPEGSEGEPEIELTQVAGGYRDLLGNPVEPKQGSCNIDVLCPEGDLWRDQIRSVARYTLSGISLCTGTLIMDVPQSFQPYFLTANHCGISQANAASIVVYWNFESPVCGELGNGSLEQTQTGAMLLASQFDVDMALVQLDDMPDPSFGVFYSGWDRSADPVLESVGIHHPSGDEKAISFNVDALTTIDSCVTGSTASNTHWKVDDWESGTTETGSSGSGLWDGLSGSLVGLLTGGFASCGNPDGFDCYGKFSVAWGFGSSAASRLKDWLDPFDQGVLAVAGANPTTINQCEPSLMSLSVGAVISGRNDEPGSTNNIDAYPCAGDGSTGPEVAYVFEPAASGNVTVSLSGLSADLDLFILSPNGVDADCEPERCFAFSNKGGIANESVTFQADAPFYFIVIDGFEGSVSEFTLSVTDASSIFADGFESGNLSAWSSAVP